MNFWNKLSEFVELSLSFIQEININAISWQSPEKAIIAGSIFLVVSALILGLSRRFNYGKRYFRAQSGHPTLGDCKEGRLRKLIYCFAPTLLAGALFFIFLALADPVLPETLTEEKVVNSRERIDLIDASPSMCFEHENTGKSLARVVKEEYIKFLRLRRNDNDRVSLWLFSSNPYMVQGFIRDYEALSFQAFSAPSALSGEKNINNIRKKVPFFCSDSQIRFIDGEGDTFLDRALSAVTRYFKDEGRTEGGERSLLIITDAAVKIYPRRELKELQRLGVVTYILFVRPNKESLSKVSNGPYATNSDLLIRDIESYGGAYFDVANTDALRKAYKKINEMETVRIKRTVTAYNRKIFQYFLFLSLLLFVLAGLTAILVEFCTGRNP